VSDDPEKSIQTFLLTASVCVFLYVILKRLRKSDLLSRPSGCYSREAALSPPLKEDVKQKLEVLILLSRMLCGILMSRTVACSMASAGFAACMGGTNSTELLSTPTMLLTPLSASPETVLQVRDSAIS